jgi:hypothetical protein
VIKKWYEAVDVCESGTCSVEDPTSLSGDMHTWWVQTWNDAGYGPWSAGMKFTIPLPPLPGKAILASPSNSVGTNNPVYTWNEVNGATWYYLWVDGSSGNVLKKWYTSDQANCNGTTCSLTGATPALATGTYTWWAQTWNEAGYGPWSDGMSFTPTPPGKATLVSPATTATNTPTYTWNEVPGSTWYYLWVDGPSGTVIQQWYTSVESNCNGTTCSVTPSITLAAGSHIWWVQTWNDAGYGPWSDGRDFLTP